MCEYYTLTEHACAWRSSGRILQIFAPYNPAVGDRVTFRRGTHNGRAKAVEVVATATVSTIERLLAAGGWVRVGSRWLPLE